MRAADLNNLRREYANWRKPEERYASRADKARKRAARPGNSLDHLAMVRKLWCSLGQRDDKHQEIHPHHLQGPPTHKFRGLGLRAPDRFVVPLVWWRHEELHGLGSRHEYEYFMDNSHGRVDPYALAQGLFSVGCDLRRATMILDAHQSQDRVLKLLSLSHAELAE